MTEGTTWAQNFLNKWLRQSVTRFLLTAEGLWAIRLTAALVVVAAAGIRKAIVAGIRQAIVVVVVDTDNILEEAAFAVE